MADWYHDDAFKLLYYELNTPSGALPESVVLNGKGRFDCSSTDPRCTGCRDLSTTVIKKGSKYKIGIVNTGTFRRKPFGSMGTTLP